MPSSFELLARWKDSVSKPNGSLPAERRVERRGQRRVTVPGTANVVPISPIRHERRRMALASRRTSSTPVKKLFPKIANALGRVAKPWSIAKREIAAQWDKLAWWEKAAAREKAAQPPAQLPSQHSPPSALAGFRRPRIGTN
jgi:hypothetical protein